MELKNKNNMLFILTIAFIVLVVIITGFVIFSLWNRTNFSSKANYDFDKDKYLDEVANIYKNQLDGLLLSSNIDSLIPLLNNDYLTSINLDKNNKEGILNYLEKEWLISKRASSLAVIDYEVAEGSNNAYIYRFKYRVNGLSKYVNLIELEPNSYTLSFDQQNIPSVSEVYIVESVDDIEFEITTEASLSTVIRYNVQITNNKSVDVKFDFNDVTKVEAILDDGSNFDLASVVVGSEEDYKLTSGSYISQTLAFSIPFAYQSRVEKLIFYSVEIGGETRNIEVNLKMQ